MRNADSPFLADLFAISLRWLILFGLALSLGISGELTAGAGTANLVLVLLLGLLILWNGFVAALAMFNRRLPWHRQVNLCLDLVFVGALFMLTGGLRGPVSWAALLPLFTGALYFGVLGALPTALFLSGFQAVYTYLTSDRTLQAQAVGMMAGFNVIAGVTVTLLSVPLIGNLRQTYEKTVNQRKEAERKAQRLERDRMRALFEMVETFSATLNYQRVLNYALETAISAVSEYNGPSEKMVGAVLLFGEKNDLEMEASRGFLPGDANAVLPAKEGILRDIMKTSSPGLIKDPSADPELARLFTLRSRSVAVCLPLIRGATAYGIMLFAHSDPDFFSSERIEVIQMLSNQAVISIQNARLYQDLAREKERIIQTQEEVKKKLSRDLHDGPTQSISAIAMRVSIARRMMEKSPREAGQELARVEELARRTTEEIRHMLFTLRPLVLESEGLAAALQVMAENVSELYQQKVIIEVDEGAIRQLDPPQQSTIFALAEEAVNNARKHAQASEIRIRIKPLPGDPGVLIAEICDNGVGFDVASVMSSYDRRGSLGMVHMQERADLLNGQMKIDSAQGKGTRIQILIPVCETAADRLYQYQ